MYLTTTLSVALVLFLIGVEAVVLLGSRHMMKELRENMALNIVLTNETDTVEICRLGEMLDHAPYCIQYRYVSREEALAEHIETLGEDPSLFLGFNPLTPAYEVYLHENYACKDSLSFLTARLQSLPYVDEVSYQQDLVDVLDNRLGEASIAMMVVALILLLISLALIVNTIRLHVYSKRFIINAMRLVGATPWVIKAPFIRRNVLMGVEASLLAWVGVGSIYHYTYRALDVLLFPFTWQNIAIVCGVVLLLGVLITFFASMFATGRYVRMKIDKMYEI